MENDLHIDQPGKRTSIDARKNRTVRGVVYLLILLFSLVLLTHVPPVQKGLVQMLVRTSNPYSNLNFSIDQTDGSFFGQLQLRGISIALHDGEQLARIDADAGPFASHKRELRERLHRLESDYGIL